MDGERFDELARAGARLGRGRFLKLALAAALGLVPGLRRREAGAQWAPTVCQGEGAFCALWVGCCGGLYCVANSAWGLTGTCSATQPAAPATTETTTETTTERKGRGKNKKRKKSRGNGQWHEADNGSGGSQKPQSGGPRKRSAREKWGRRQYNRRKRRGML